MRLFLLKQMLDKQPVPIQPRRELRHHCGLPLYGLHVQRLHAGTGGVSAVGVKERGLQHGGQEWLEEDAKGENEKIVEGLGDSAGPQLCVGVTMGVSQHNVHLPPRNLCLYCI